MFRIKRIPKQKNSRLLSEPAALSHACFCRSEADMWPQSYLQVVIGAVVEINLIADIQTNPNRPNVDFHASTRIKDSVGIACGDLSHGSGKSRGCVGA